MTRLQQTLDTMGKEDYERYKTELRRRERHAPAGEQREEYHEDHPGHPLGPGMPPGDTLRADGESHRDAWMTVLRRDPCAFCDRQSGTVDHVEPQGLARQPRERPLICNAARRRLHLHDWTNFAGACPSCNTSKGDGDMLTFLLKRRGVVLPKPVRLAA